MIQSDVSPLRWNAQTQSLELLDQLALPETERWLTMQSVDDIAAAITHMIVRGAPAIGITAAFGMYYAARLVWHNDNRLDLLRDAKNQLSATRPTAVNLFWALNRMMRCVECHINDVSPEAILSEAQAIWREDIEMNRAMAVHGADAIGSIKNILTHCNAGALATGAIGTALGVVRELNDRQKNTPHPLHVWVDETRPYLQGARLTAWELMKDHIDCSLITDNMSAYLMSKGLVDAIIVGADRIAKNYDIANKIGTYALAVLANFHHVPFYVAAPDSTFDDAIETGDDIVIEERSAEEVVCVKGKRIAPEGVHVRHPAFDVTPHTLITGIITPHGVINPNA